ncbi:MAG: SDR family oxidoreductase [Bacteroidales bacterium]|nr:SDR family oxidoreductase [Bacteroidales bacterium]
MPLSQSKIVFITGASSGIGEACAIRFAREGYALILNARRKKRLDELARRLKNDFGVKVLKLVFDVRNKESVFSAIAALPEEWKNIDILINNAGLALGLSDLHEGDTQDWEQMIDTNVKGLLYVSKAVIPGMIERKKGHIINIGSIAGKETYLKGNVYCATKHAVDSLSKAMRMELLPHNIKVSLVNPGATQTEFSQVRFKGDTERADSIYKGYKPLTGDDIARCILFCAALPEHVNINDMLIMPTAQATAGLFNKKTE